MLLFTSAADISRRKLNIAMKLVIKGDIFQITDAKDNTVEENDGRMNLADLSANKRDLFYAGGP